MCAVEGEQGKAGEIVALLKVEIDRQGRKLTEAVRAQIHCEKSDIRPDISASEFGAKLDTVERRRFVIEKGNIVKVKVAMNRPDMGRAA